MNAPTVRGSKGPVQLGKQLGKGGEGVVYEVVGQPGLVAKVYLRDIPAERAEKLRAMSQLLTPKLAALTAWPHDVLYGGGNKVTGFLMPKIRAHDVHEVYGPKSRQQIFPQADWRLLVRTALNTARAFAVVHEAGILVADVNHGGVMVSADATVRLIDCDSFQFTAGAKTFLCEVGVEDFTPPELQGKVFRSIVRTANHDNFGLAILIFRLLMLGRHPFAGKHLGKGDLSLGEAIAQCKYAYSRERAITQMVPPPASPQVLVAGQEIADLWERAFSRAGMQPHGRPTSEQWVFALQKLEANFAKCSSHGGHYFARGVQCPWCAIQLSTGASPFPLPMGAVPPAHASGPFSLEAVWAQITSVPSPPAAQPATASAAVAVPSTEAQRYASRKRMLSGFGVLAALTVFAAGIANGIVWVLSGLAAWAAWGIFRAMTPSIDKAQYRQRKTLAENELRSLTDRWMKEASSQAFEAKLNELRRQRDELVKLPATRQAQYSRLVSNREAAAKKKFLDKFEISNASISGIGPAKKSMLESYGIETAADISRNAILNVPGFGPALTTRLMDWKRTVEARFRFDPNSGVDPRDVADLDQRIAQQKRDLEDSLRKGTAELHQIRNTILSRRQALEGPMRTAARSAAQADADMRVIQ
jgi:DNA-binding helix-hairpin-helix protein with protein kinase domain